MKEQKLIKAFKALSDPTRLQIINYLHKCGEKPCTDMLSEFKLAQPTMSHHFAVLIEAGLITKTKKSVSNYYSLNLEIIEEIGLDLEKLSK